MKIIRTNHTNPDFSHLVNSLDEELAVRDGDDHDFYHQFNSIDNIEFAVVLYLDETPIGCGALKPLDNSVIEVKRIFVDKKYRGQKLAGTIMEELENWALELQYSHCRLETGVNQPEAIRLYHRCNYLIIENYDQYAGINTSICFEKEL